MSTVLQCPVYTFQLSTTFNVPNKSPTDKNRNTPLHTAAGFGRVHVTKFLLKIVQDKFPINKFKKTPLQMAENNGFCSQINYIELKKLYESAKSKKRPRE